MQVDWPINDILSNLELLVTGLHKQTVVISKWSFVQVPLYTYTHSYIMYKNIGLIWQKSYLLFKPACFTSA